MLLELLEVTLVISSAFGQGNPQMANDVPRDPYDLGIYGNVRMPDGRGSGNGMREGGMEMSGNGNGMPHDGVRMPHDGIRMPNYEMGIPWFGLPNDGMKLPYNGGMPGGKMECLMMGWEGLN